MLHSLEQLSVTKLLHKSPQASISNWRLLSYLLTKIIAWHVKCSLFGMYENQKIVVIGFLLILLETSHI